jgi:amino acid adenylation domain-containing protein
VLPDLLEVAVVHHPDALALTDGRERLTWRQYRDAAAALAAELAERGVGVGERVGVLMPKSARSFVAVHAIQRIGAVVVPVDWFAPAEHALDVLTDADAAAVVGPLTTARWQAVIERFGGVVDPAAIPVGDATSGEQAPAHRGGSDDPAYIIYTSGSTGRPKGIVHTHESALAYARLAVETYDLGRHDRLANIAPLHFDQSTFELYAGPLSGATAIVVPDAAMKFPASLARLLASEGATVLYTVPYVIEQLVERGAIDGMPSLRWVKFGGESFTPASLRTAMRAIPTARFSNVYGPAEVNQCTFHHLDAPPSDDSPVPIGRPWPGVDVRIVVDGDVDAAADEIGELWVDAPTAMRGYWNRADLTDAAFVAEPGHRWYRTGDLVRRVDDELVFVGRLDHQVKLRGQRIELEAVDAVLLAHPSVEAAVCFVDRSEDDDRLVALVSPGLPTDVLDDIRRHAAGHLPRYAVPTVIEAVATLPRTSTGKADRPAAARRYASSVETPEPR